MGDHEETAIRCRYRAGEVRTLAVLTQDEKTREMLLIVAENYESLAAALDDLAKNNRVLGR